MKYAYYHFTTEENLMLRYGYPEFIGHKAKHDAFKQTLAEFIEKRERGEDLHIDLSKFLKNWLTGHIIGTDKKFAPYILERMKRK